MGVAKYLNLSHLPVLDHQRSRAVPKGASRLQRSTQESKDEAKAERAWKTAVWTRDKGLCRWCRRQVIKTISLVPERGEVHHVASREVKAIRWDRRNGILLCASDHERLTGKVNERCVIVSAKTFQVDGVRYLNADRPVTFKRIA